MRRALIAALVFVMYAATAAAQNSSEGQMKAPPTIEQKTAGMQKFPGFFTYYWDARSGKIWLQVDKWNAQFLYYESLPNGVGSNDVGLDRGQPGKTSVVHFERSGPRVLLVEENERYRAVTDDLEQQEAVRQAFAQSVLWGFDAAAEDGDTVLVDATPFFMSDAHEVAARLATLKQGTYRVDASRSAIFLPRTKNFPENTDVESILTFTGENPGHWVEEVTPDPRAITVHEHFSFIQAPGPGFHERAYDPRSSFFGMAFMDFATPVDQPIVKRYIAHWRLAKKDPSAAMSEPVKPLVYYVDRAIPEPIRSAVLEGASWWNQAFTAAGYKDGFQVKLLPEGVDPMDVRYNVIEWVPRATRGWAYGSAIDDPRTGEIINGHVNLDALRIRQDFLIAQGLLDPFGKDPEELKKANEMALARIRQLAAHETGHTLGLAHNYSASIVNRSSVMDYPPPTVTVGADGKPDVSNAYAVGIGAWDKVSIAYGYSDLSLEKDETAALDGILSKAFSSGLLFLTDQDARPLGSSSSLAHLWDTGSNDLDGLKQVMAVRAAALKNFSAAAIPEHAPMATLEDVLVPAYLYHRYQVMAVAKWIGGQDYTFNLRGSGDRGPEIVPAEQQRKAISAVLATLSPQVLALPEPILKMIPPRPPEYPAGRENFARRTSPAFDILAPAEAAAEVVANLVLQPERAQRMIEFHALDSANPDFAELVDDLLNATWKAQPAAGYDGAVQRTVDSVVLDHLMNLAADEHASAAVRAVAALKLDELRKWIATQAPLPKFQGMRAQFFFAQSEIEHFQKNPEEVHLTTPAPPPDGDPIGSDGWE
ncbi:MAG TPA: zinc-dependent metalloprotease [Candidatus Limnocylindrales bacterium]|nr:zinc-dependent metalloprotease [Candidatus Limnocylindrales bacterium]